mgnify:CR=1 FL=1|jgi:SAM-dependent methyltransferase
MQFLYGKNYSARYHAISEIIPEGESVLDICCGDCALYKRVLIKKNISYTGIDINKKFVASSLKKSVNVLQLDIRNNVIPKADYVLMQASLYQFIPNHKLIIDKLLRSANKKLIISEPIRNLSSSNNSIIKFIARYSANPGTGHTVKRFSEETFRRFFTDNYKNVIVDFVLLPGGRELMVILDARAGN